MCSQVGCTYEKHIEWGSQLEVQPVSYSPNTCDEPLPISVTNQLNGLWVVFFFVCGFFCCCSLLVLYIYIYISVKDIGCPSLCFLISLSSTVKLYLEIIIYKIKTKQEK